MFFAPKEINRKLESLLSTILTEPWYQKSFTFDAAHHLFHYEGNVNPFMVTPIICRLLSVDFLDERGMTYDFGDIKSDLQELLRTPTWTIAISMRLCLNMNTTAENMVYWIFQTTSQELPDERGLRLEYVRLYETPTAFAEFRREWLDD